MAIIRHDNHTTQSKSPCSPTHVGLKECFEDEKNTPPEAFERLHNEAVVWSFLSEIAMTQKPSTREAADTIISVQLGMSNGLQIHVE